MKALYGTQMKIGTPADILCKLSATQMQLHNIMNIFYIDPAAGGSIDWVKDYGKVKYSFALELRPGENATGNGFILPTDHIVPTGEETWAGISVVADEVIKRFAN